MSSVLNGLHSDNLASDLSNGVRRTGAPKSPRQPRSSVPPSESNAFSDVEGFADDEVVGARGTDRNRPRDPMSKAVPRVVDKVGEKVAEEFENFLEQYDLQRLLESPRLTIAGSSKTSHSPAHQHQALSPATSIT